MGAPLSSASASWSLARPTDDFTSRSRRSISEERIARVVTVAMAMHTTATSATAVRTRREVSEAKRDFT